MRQQASPTPSTLPHCGIQTPPEMSSYHRCCGQVGHVLVAAVTYLELLSERREQELCWESVCPPAHRLWEAVLGSHVP